MSIYADGTQIYALLGYNTSTWLLLTSYMGTSQHPIQLYHWRPPVLPE